MESHAMAYSYINENIDRSNFRHVLDAWIDRNWGDLWVEKGYVKLPVMRTDGCI